MKKSVITDQRKVWIAMFFGTVLGIEWHPRRFDLKKYAKKGH